MPRVTALRPDRRGRVVVELDGAPWRTIPLEVAVRAGLATELELDRPRLRALGRELRRHEALGAAVSTLRRTDFSTAALSERLERRGVAPAARAEALGVLERAGLLDDVRAAGARAEALARRGAGDAMVRADLSGRGFGPEVVEAALASLEPEAVRAVRLAAERGGGPRAARFLARRGFGAESIESALPGLVADSP